MSAREGAVACRCIAQDATSRRRMAALLAEGLDEFLVLLFAVARAVLDLEVVLKRLEACLVAAIPDRACALYSGRTSPDDRPQP